MPFLVSWWLAHVPGRDICRGVPYITPYSIQSEWNDHSQMESTVMITVYNIQCSPSSSHSSQYRRHGRYQSIFVAVSCNFWRLESWAQERCQDVFEALSKKRLRLWSLTLQVTTCIFRYIPNGTYLVECQINDWSKLFSLRQHQIGKGLVNLLAIWRWLHKFDVLQNSHVTLCLDCAIIFKDRVSLSNNPAAKKLCHAHAYASLNLPYNYWRIVDYW